MVKRGGEYYLAQLHILGPCKVRSPFYGYVRRAMNRAWEDSFPIQLSFYMYIRNS